MPSKRRSGCGQPKVYIDVDDSTVSLNVSNNAAEVTSEPGDVNTGGSPHPYFLCKVDNDWSEEEEVVMSSDGDFLSSSDEYQPESESDGMDSENDGDLWEENDSEVESIKVEQDSDEDFCEDRVMYPRASRKSSGTPKVGKKTRNLGSVNETRAYCKMSLRSSGLKTRSNKVYTTDFTKSHKRQLKRKKHRSHQKNGVFYGQSTQHDANSNKKQAEPEPDESMEPVLRQQSLSSPVTKLSFSDNICILVQNDGRKTWCIYCGRNVSQLAQHLQYKHRREAKVVKWNRYGVNTVKRRQMLQQIIDKGLCLHNDKVIKSGKGALIPVKNPVKTDGLTTDQFCRTCYTFMDKNFMESHRLACSRQEKNEDCDVQICDPFEITEDMIKRMEDKLKLVSKDGQITIIEDKRHDGRVNCAFCHTTPCHFSRHIEEKHSEEPIVSNTIKHPKGSKERKRGWTKIRNSFSFLHNKAVLERGTGGLMVQYVSQNKDPSHLKVCPFCYGLYANLQIHVKRCGSSPQLTSKKVENTCECMSSVDEVSSENRDLPQTGSLVNRSYMDLTAGQETSVDLTTGQGTSVDLTTGQGTSVDLTTGQGTSVDLTTGQETSVDLTTGQGTSVDLTTGQGTSVDLTTGQGTSMDLTTGQGTSVELTTGQGTSVDLTTGQGTSVDLTTGQGTSVDLTTGQGTSVDLTTGQGTSVDLTTGQETSGRNTQRVNGGGIRWQTRWDGKKKVLKRNCCFYCKTQVFTMCRHFISIHGTEKEVQKALKYSKQSKERREVFSGLIFKGNNEHNKRILQLGRGTLIPPRKLQEVTDDVSADFSYCPECFSRVRTENMWAHKKRHRLSKSSISKKTDEDESENKQGRESVPDNTSNNSANDGYTQNDLHSTNQVSINHLEDENSGGVYNGKGSSSESTTAGGEENGSTENKEDLKKVSTENNMNETENAIVTIKKQNRDISCVLKHNADISILLSTQQSFCLYCQQSSINIIKHLEAEHFYEKAVEEAIRMPREFEAGKKLWNDLIQRGNKDHNDRVMQAGSGDLVPLRRLQKIANVNHYEFCFTCYIFIKKSDTMHKYFCESSRQTFENIEEEKLRLCAAVDKCKCSCKTKEATLFSNNQKQRRKQKYHVRSDGAFSFNQTKKTGRQMVHKRNCCLFCHKLVTDMSRHLKIVHNNQEDVQRALKYPEKSRKRRQLFTELLKRGNYEHNRRVSHLGSGFLIPVKLGCRKVGDFGKYAHCEVCFGLYSQETLWKHRKLHRNQPVDPESPQVSSSGDVKASSRRQRQSVSKKLNSMERNAEVLNEHISDESDDEWDIGEYKRLWKARNKRIKKRKQSEEEAMQQETTRGGKKKRKGVTLWSDEEMSAILEHFSGHIQELKVPGKEQCMAAKERFPEALKKRDWKNIKFCVYNKIQAHQKSGRREEVTKSASKQPWSQEEVCAVEKFMKKFIDNLETPGKLDCLQVKRKCRSALQNRTWKQIKFYVYNRIFKKRKMPALWTDVK